MNSKKYNQILNVLLILAIIYYVVNLRITGGKIVEEGIYTVGVITKTKKQLRGSRYVVSYEYWVNEQIYSNKSLQWYEDFNTGECFYVKFLPKNPQKSLLLSDIPVPTENLNLTKSVWTEFPHPKKSRFESREWKLVAPALER